MNADCRFNPYIAPGYQLERFLLSVKLGNNYRSLVRRCRNPMRLFALGISKERICYVAT